MQMFRCTSDAVRALLGLDEDTWIEIIKEALIQLRIRHSRKKVSPHVGI